MSEVKDFKKLSDRQQNILIFMFDYMEEKGFPPTIREIGEATDINSTSVVNYNLNKLVDAGYLDRTDRVSRGLQIIAPIPGRESKEKKAVRLADKIDQVPLYGKIAAGEPIELPEDIAHFSDDGDFIDVTSMMISGIDPRHVFALQVQGDSMIDAMISDGDYVILRSQQTANNGDMVAVWLSDRGETTLKYFYKEGDKIRLEPAHPTMDSIYVDARQCEVRGRVLSVIRRVQ